VGPPKCNISNIIGPPLLGGRQAEVHKKCIAKQVPAQQLQFLLLFHIIIQVDSTLCTTLIQHESHVCVCVSLPLHAKVYRKCTTMCHIAAAAAAAVYMQKQFTKSV
jgi:hypothetical protein